MTRDWYPEYIKKYESMKKRRTPNRKMGKRHEQVFHKRGTLLYMKKTTQFH